MRADPEERLSTEPIPIKAKREKTTWIDIALGIYIGGLALTVTLSTMSAIAYSIYVERMKVELDRELHEMFNQRQ